MICSRGDALSRLPLAIIFRAFGASIREHISRLGASIREHIWRLRRFDSRTHFAPRRFDSRTHFAPRRFDSRTHFVPFALPLARTVTKLGADGYEPPEW